jgi:hypothetical protein
MKTLKFIVIALLAVLYSAIAPSQCLDYQKRECLRKIAYSQIDVFEATGNNDGATVEMYLHAAGQSKGAPWCASFVYWTILQCGDTLDLELPAYVPSYFPKDKIIWKQGAIIKRTPQFGDVIGIWNSEKGRLAHIGFYDGENSQYIFTVEGNTNEAGSREGDGVYRKKRIKRQVYAIAEY